MRWPRLLILSFPVLALGQLRSVPAAEEKPPHYVAPLVHTKWIHSGAYALAAPQKQSLGSWTSAVAQIMRNHKLAPQGKISYITQGAGVMRIDCDRLKFNWSLLTASLNRRSRRAELEHVVRYMMATAAVLQRNFGGDGYVLDTGERLAAIEKHFRAKTELVETEDIQQVRKRLVAELAAERPVLMHVRNRRETTFRAVVVDGYRFKDDDFYIHINMARPGRGNGWYKFAGPIAEFDDEKYRVLVTFQPREE